ncbi:MAG: hypothetical protein WAR37_00545 [Candidatus Microsaccharimonas sp.]
MLTWLAYSLYDHVIDEKTDILNVPIANILSRTAQDTYRKSGVRPEDISKIFTITDTANIQEIITTIYNSTDQKLLLPERSIAHITGPLHIATLIDRRYYSKVYKALSYYCAARQLNDDLHDWVEDLHAGRITYVTSLLIEESDIDPSSLTLNRLTFLLKRQFFETTLSRCLNEIIELCHKSRSILESTILKEGSEFNGRFIRPIEDSAEKALIVHKKNYELVQHLKKISS